PGRRARLLVPRAAAGDRGPDADRLGPQRRADPGRGRVRVRAADRRERPRRRVRRHGPSRDGRAPDALQRAARSVHCGTGTFTGWVIAPSEALETSAAYLPRTPRVSISGGS